MLMRFSFQVDEVILKEASVVFYTFVFFSMWIEYTKMTRFFSLNAKWHNMCKVLLICSPFVKKTIELHRHCKTVECNILAFVRIDCSTFGSTISAKAQEINCLQIRLIIFQLRSRCIVVTNS